MKKISEVTDLFYRTVVGILEDNLKKQREKDPQANAALVDIDMVAALKACGADTVDIRASVNAGTKDNNKGDKFTFITVTPKVDGVGERIEFSQRHQAHKAEVAAMEKHAQALTNFKEAKCIAGLHVTPLSEGKVRKDWSFKWEELVIDEENGIKYTGPVRKWNETTQTYDVPVID